MRGLLRVVGFAALSAMLATGMTAGVAAAQQYGGPPQGYGQGPDRGQGWDTPPPEFAAARQRGFRDGVEGARRDFENHRPPNVNNRDEFRHPGVAGPDRHEYREGFKRGYDQAVRHMFGNGQGPR